MHRANLIEDSCYDTLWRTILHLNRLSLVSKRFQGRVTNFMVEQCRIILLFGMNEECDMDWDALYICSSEDKQEIM